MSGSQARHGCNEGRGGEAAPAGGPLHCPRHLAGHHCCVCLYAHYRVQVPRKSYDKFHPDIFPDTHGPVASMGPGAWLAGDNEAPAAISLGAFQLIYETF